MANTFKTPLQKAVVGWLTAHPDVSLRELGRRTEIDHSDLGKITKGDKASLNMESAGRLAAAMGVTIEQLLAGQSEGDGPNAVRPIPIDLIDPSPHNPRKDYDKDELAGLAASIQESGLLQPLVVMNSLTKGRFELIAGHRRLRALKLNNADTALCLVRTAETTASARALQIIENLQRVDIPPLEEAQAFAALQDENKTHWTATAIGKLIGKSDRFVAQRINIARNLAADLQQKLAAGELKVEVARILAGAPSKLQKIMAKDPWALRDADTVRRKLQDKAIPVSTAAFKIDLYDGEYLVEGDKKWFADKAKFNRLQSDAADARVERLKKTWPTAQRVNTQTLGNFVWADDGGSINSWWENKAEAKKRKKGITESDCTAVVWLERNKIRTAKNVVPREVWDAKIDKAKPQRVERDRPERASKEERQADAVTAALAQGLPGRPDLARRLVVYAFLGNLGGADLEINVDPRPHLGDQAEQLGQFLGGDGFYLDRYDPEVGAEDKLWSALRALDDAAIDGLISRFMSEVLHVPAFGKADGLHRAIAAELGVEIPARFVPEPVADEVGGPAEASDHDAGTDAEVAEAA
jgi:ParB/RepB/Spo0J family partition protein